MHAHEIKKKCLFIADISDMRQLSLTPSIQNRDIQSPFLSRRRSSPKSTTAASSFPPYHATNRSSASIPTGTALPACCKIVAQLHARSQSPLVGPISWARRQLTQPGRSPRWPTAPALAEHTPASRISLSSRIPAALPDPCHPRCMSCPTPRRRHRPYLFRPRFP
jgi:hypothetical protein